MDQHFDTRRLGAVRPWHLFAASGLSGLVALVALRLNYQKMVALRSAVFEADRTDGDIEGALRDLRHHVNSHMNTSLTSGNDSIYPPIQLKYHYDRLVAKQQAASDNTEVYTQAQAYCEQQNHDFSGRNRVPCIQQYVSEHGGQAQVVIPDSLYKFDFVSPTWSPDLAGWSLVVTALFFIAGCGLLLKKLLSRR